MGERTKKQTKKNKHGGKKAYSIGNEERKEGDCGETSHCIKKENL